MRILKRLGFTSGGKPVLGGSFQMADTHGLPLAVQLAAATDLQVSLSIPHFFASAMEAGWDDHQTFSRLREAFSDAGAKWDPTIERACVAMLMEFAAPGRDAREMGRLLREYLEKIIIAMYRRRKSPARRFVVSPSCKPSETADNDCNVESVPTPRQQKKKN